MARFLLFRPNLIRGQENLRWHFNVGFIVSFMGIVKTSLSYKTTLLWRGKRGVSIIHAISDQGAMHRVFQLFRSKTESPSDWVTSIFIWN